jgi:hypothetical protein
MSHLGFLLATSSSKGKSQQIVIKFLLMDVASVLVIEKDKKSPKN